MGSGSVYLFLEFTINGDDPQVFIEVKKEGNVDFVHFAFLYQLTRTTNSDGKEYRVLFGRKLDCKRLTKIESARTETYKPLIDINGNFKRRSVIQISG